MRWFGKERAGLMLQGATKMPKGFVCILIERCKGCGFCVEFCPTQVLALSSALNSKGYHPPQVINAEKCSGCDLCGMYCPDFAIVGGKYESAKSEPAAGSRPRQGVEASP